jgi:UDP-GlcNAc:undecaprenyl-phosphate/decaprenyl-phosphate GlcNAc-1-phosphate transferase
MLNFVANYWFFITMSSIFGIICSYILTLVLVRYANQHNINDNPNSALFRKFQKAPVTLVGGTAACAVALMMMSITWLLVKFDILDSVLITSNLSEFKLIWVIVACISMLYVGYLDDKIQLSARWQFISILSSILIVIFLGNIRIENITSFGELTYWVSIIITIAWLGFATASTKFLDGHDGLVTSVGLFNFLTIASISLSPKINQPIIFLFSWFWALCLAVFLFFNFPNAKAYLGEGASEMIGFMIGVLAILSGAKLATALSILGWFILDIFLVWAIRISQGRNPITSADRNHWHHRLLEFGLNKIQVLVVTWLLLVISSFIGVYGDTTQKLLLILLQFVILITIYIFTPKKSSTTHL